MSTPKTVRKGRMSFRITQKVTVQGPRGKVLMEVPEFVKLGLDKEKGIVTLSVEKPDDKIQRSMWGTIRSLVNNNVIGVNEGHMAVLKFVGTGYRGQVENDGKFVTVKVGASIKQGLTVPDGINVSSPMPTSLLIDGCDKQQVLLFAAKLRNFHPPEPYKGKGIFVNGETIKLKDKKIK